MNFYEAQEFFKKMFPDKLKTFSFDDKCIHHTECIMTEGLPNIYHHVEYDKVKVTIPGMEDQYVSIEPHRDNLSWSQYKKLINSKTEIYIHPETKKLMLEAKADPNRAQEYQAMLTEYSYNSGMEISAIEAKIRG